MKPISIKIINGLLALRYLVIFTILSVTGYVIYNSPEPGILTGIANAMIKTASIETPIVNPDESFGMAIGYLLPTMIILFLEFLFVNKKKSKGFLIVIGIDILIILLLRNLPLIAIIILVLGLTKKSKEYFKKKATDK